LKIDTSDLGKWEQKVKISESELTKLESEHSKYIGGSDKTVEIKELGLKFTEYSHYMDTDDYDGKACYILYFKKTGAYYVGQTRNLISRQKNHID